MSETLFMCVTYCGSRKFLLNLATFLDDFWIFKRLDGPKLMDPVLWVSYKTVVSHILEALSSTARSSFTMMMRLCRLCLVTWLVLLPSFVACNDTNDSAMRTVVERRRQLMGQVRRRYNARPQKMGGSKKTSSSNYNDREKEKNTYKTQMQLKFTKVKKPSGKKPYNSRYNKRGRNGNSKYKQSNKSTKSSKNVFKSKRYKHSKKSSRWRYRKNTRKPSSVVSYSRLAQHRCVAISSNCIEII